MMAGRYRLIGTLAAVLTAFLAPVAAHACVQPADICETEGPGSFPLLRGGVPATVYVDPDADPAIRRVARDFAKDLGRVSGRDALVTSDLAAVRGPLVLIGEIGASAALERLVAAGRFDAGDLAGQWEAYRQTVVDNPFPGVASALVIAGADRRGAVFGTYDISERMGVSPWYWWADVPVAPRQDIFVAPGMREDAPKVRYRGFFLNDEDPALSGWARKAFGGVNAAMYEHVFELLLRLKGNYLWPAMWGKAFHVDDPGNTVLAHEMGVIMGTSHHEPLTRAQAEWNAEAMGPWDYRANGAELRQFWRGGIERMMTACGAVPCDSLVTIGMRGDGDEPMSQETAIELLETIVADQRAILTEVTARPAPETPQVWALYKEVQDYYDQGMRVPEDVILLFADDNWGQIRRLPQPDAAPRKGGYGVYYHFDYVGGPRSYKWLNTNQIEKTWQQMDLAWQSGARALWIVNVGDLKPMEFPLDFFMEQAWNPEAMTPARLQAFPRDFALQSFGDGHADEVARLLTDYARLAARRKPELVGPESFASEEFTEMLEEWDRLLHSARTVAADLPEFYRPAFFQLAEHPISAVANLYRLYYSAAMNRRLAAAGDGRANRFADAVRRYFAEDRAITARYHAVNGGKWDGMLNQTHIGYTGWDDPEEDVMPATVRIDAPPGDGFLIETAGNAGWSFSVEAPDYARAFGSEALQWTVVPDLGRTRGAVIAMPQGQAPTAPADGIRLEYDLHLPGGEVPVRLLMVPTLDVRASGGIRIGISLDEGPVRILAATLRATGVAPVNPEEEAWEEAVRDNAHVLGTIFTDVAPGKHVLKVWRIDDNAVLQRIAIGPETGRYLGPKAGGGEP